MTFEIYDPEKHGVDNQDYREPLEENQYEDDCEECGGKQFVIDGHGYYNGLYQCYTLTLECENCGPYDVECV